MRTCATVTPPRSSSGTDADAPGIGYRRASIIGRLKTEPVFDFDMNRGSACQSKNDPDRTAQTGGSFGSLPGGRPERADKARNRSRILAAASKAFAASGFDMQMDEIAIEAGLGVGTLYGHYPTKDTLVGALVKGKYEALVQIAKELAERAESDSHAALAEFIRRSGDYTAADAGTRDAVLRAGDSAVAAFPEVVDQLRGFTQLLVDRARRDRTVRDDLTVDDIALIMHAAASAMGDTGRDWRRLLDLFIEAIRS